MDIEWLQKTYASEGDKELAVNCYVNTSFYTDPDDSKSQSGYVFILNGGAISWCSSKKSIIDIEYLQNTYGSEYDRPVD